MPYPISYNKSAHFGHPSVHSGTTPPLVRHTNLNQNYQSYKILRDRINDKIQEVVLTLDNPNSSINRFVKELRSKYNASHVNKINNIINKIYHNSDKLLSLDGIDSYDYFENMKIFTKNMENLLNEVSGYMNTIDAVDELNPTEANYNLTRLVNDFKILEKTENNFPRAFRINYVNENQKQVKSK